MSVSDTRPDWQQLFVGREPELRFLLDAFEGARGGEPQFVVLLGESGLGKTRIVQEFYKRLSTERDPHDYWPDAIAAGDSLAVNPTFGTDDGRPRSAIPWLWWGLRWFNPGRRNAAGEGGMSGHRGALFPHAVPIAARRNLRGLRTDAAVTTAGLVLNAIPVVGQAAGLIFTAKDLFELGRQSREERREQDRGVEAVGASQSGERKSLVDLAEDFFHTLMAEGAGDGGPIPAVLFLDDAQWIDPDALRFAERLGRSAKREGWPLLVVATHWEQEWHEGLAARRPASEPAARFTDLTDRPGLPIGTWIVREIGKVPELGEALDALLPGLTKPQRELLLDRADGNPLFLEQLMRFLLDEPALFENGDPAGPLTPGAEAEVRKELTDLHRTVRSRFRRMAEEVKRALGWSSVQGTRFLTALTVAAARRVDPDAPPNAVADGLRRGERPHGQVRFGPADDSGRYNLGEFRQNVFREVAGRHLDTLRQRDLVEAAVRETLTDWIKDESIGDLPAAERRDALLLARARLRPVADGSVEAWRTWGLAMCLLVADYEAETLWDQAVETAKAFADAREWGDVSLPLLRLDAPAKCLLDFGDTVGASTLYRTALKQASSNAALDDAPDSSHEHFVMLIRAGDIKWADGHPREAGEFYVQAAAISDRLVSAPELTARSIRDHLGIFIKLGDVERAAGRLDKSEEYYRKSLACGELAIRMFRGNKEPLRSYAVALDHVGDADRLNNDLASARRRYGEALKVVEQLRRTVGKNAETQGDYVVALSKIGDVDLEAGELSDARDWYAKAVTAAEPLEHLPKTLRYLVRFPAERSAWPCGGLGWRAIRSPVLLKPP